MSTSKLDFPLAHPVPMQEAAGSELLMTQNAHKYLANIHCVKGTLLCYVLLFISGSCDDKNNFIKDIIKCSCSSVWGHTAVSVGDVWAGPWIFGSWTGPLRHVVSQSTSE